MPAEVKLDYNNALPLMLARYYPTGLLGLGLTALLASFMSGMAGNVTAFNTVWTYDIYQAYLRPRESDEHYGLGSRSFCYLVERFVLVARLSLE